MVPFSADANTRLKNSSEVDDAMMIIDVKSASCTPVTTTKPYLHNNNDKKTS